MLQTTAIPAPTPAPKAKADPEEPKKVRLDLALSTSCDVTLKAEIPGVAEPESTTIDSSTETDPLRPTPTGGVPYRRTKEYPQGTRFTITPKLVTYTLETSAEVTATYALKESKEMLPLADLEVIKYEYKKALSNYLAIVDKEAGFLGVSATSEFRGLFVDSNGVIARVAQPPTSTFGYTSQSESIRLLPIEIVDANKASVSKLKVGKMSATDVLTGSDSFARLDVDKDPDRFFIRVPGGAALGGVSVKVSTTDNSDTAYNDNATQIDLQTEGGDAITKSLLLVSDDVDDAAQVDSIADDATGDRTHKVQLGGNLKIEAIKIGTGGWQIMDAKTPVPALKKLKCDVVVLKVGGAVVRPNAEVEAAMKMVQERYAQVGVKVEYAIVERDPPAGVDLTDGVTVRDVSESHTLSAEGKSFLDGLATVGAAKDVHIFFINRAKIGADDVRGTAVADYWYDESEESYTYNLFVANISTPFTAAHELGHLLTDAGHHAAEINLMKTSTDQTNTLGATKRFDTDQETRIHSSDRLSAP